MVRIDRARDESGLSRSLSGFGSLLGFFFDASGIFLDGSVGPLVSACEQKKVIRGLEVPQSLIRLFPVVLITLPSDPLTLFHYILRYTFSLILSHNAGML